ncbi:cdc42 effector protein 3 [Eucyclogobius newberryi]|uniref:cdc42 effector protein 3 n=1 Tax=Eucyclogobius newberryi TaxID=166745 RepID=UPI003B5C1622
MPLRTSFYRKPSSSRWSNRKRKDVLSVNMISLPLADFRHITHIGNDAHTDSFGDLSFLKEGHSLLLQSSQSEQNLFMACSPPPKPPRLNLDEPEGSESPEWGSQKRIKCSSMPILDSDDGEIETEPVFQKGNHVLCQNNSPKQHNEHSATGEDHSDNIATTSKDEDSGFSFSLDLGPSILDDVLQVMDKRNN